MSDSVLPHRWQPTRLRHPWVSPGKNTGVGCHFLLQCMKVKVKSLSHAQLLATPWTAAYQAPPSMGFSRQEYWSGLPLPSPHRKANSIIYNLYYNLDSRMFTWEGLKLMKTPWKKEDFGSLECQWQNWTGLISKT